MSTSTVTISYVLMDPQGRLARYTRNVLKNPVYVGDSLTLTEQASKALPTHLAFGACGSWYLDTETDTKSFSRLKLRLDYEGTEQVKQLESASSAECDRVLEGLPEATPFVYASDTARRVCGVYVLNEDKTDFTFRVGSVPGTVLDVGRFIRKLPEDKQTALRTLTQDKDLQAFIAQLLLKDAS